jgi:two-component system, response regulator PdtaR
VIHNVSPRPTQHPPTILVVEDNALVRLVAVEFLEDSGFKVVEADSADGAIDLLTCNGPIDAVFSDVQMPGTMDGVELAHWISREMPDVKVLLTSGNAPTQAGMPILPKPYDLPSVARRLKGMIAH